jgi:hypothetical protein
MLVVVDCVIPLHELGSSNLMDLNGAPIVALNYVPVDEPFIARDRTHALHKFKMASPTRAFVFSRRRLHVHSTHVFRRH